MANVEGERNNAERVIDDRDRLIQDFVIPTLNDLNPGIVRPDLRAIRFELKPIIFQMLQMVGQFSRAVTDNSHRHLKVFGEVSDSVNFPGVSTEALRVKLFPYSLRDRVRDWLNNIPSDTITMWGDLAKKFIMKYHPPVRNARMRNEITNFQQKDGESLYEACDRFKELLRQCPIHGIPHWIQLETFYNGLNGETRSIIDAAASKTLLSKSFNEAYDLLERMTVNSYQWPSDRNISTKHAPGVYDIDEVAALNAKIASLENAIKAINKQPQLQTREVS